MYNDVQRINNTEQHSKSVCFAVYARLLWPFFITHCFTIQHFEQARHVVANLDYTKTMSFLK